MSERKVNLGIRTSEERQRRLKQVALDRRSSVQALVDDAIESQILNPLKSGVSDQPKAGGKGLGQNSGLSHSVTRDILPESEWEKTWVRSLLRVLRSGNERFISAVTENISIFVDFCDAEKGDTEPGAAGTPPGPHRNPPASIRGRASKG